jgi:membrane-associated phospholipid phosphatase
VPCRRYGFPLSGSARHSAVAASLACVACFALLVGLAYGADALQSADRQALNWFAASHDTVLGSLASVATFFVDPVPLLIIVAIVCSYGVWQGRLTEAAAALAVVAGANLTSQLVKNMLSHDRLQAFVENPPDLWTFPSGHVTAAASLVLAIAWVAPVRRRRQVLARGSLFVLAVGLSVLVLGWHFPSDVLGGILVALGWGFGVLAVYLVLPPRLRRFSGRPPTPPPAPRAAISAK